MLHTFFTWCRYAYASFQRRNNVPLTVPAHFCMPASLAGQRVEAPCLVEGGPPQQHALSLVFMILHSKATLDGELHFNVILEHVDVRRCALFALALYLWAKHDLNGGHLPVGLVDRSQLGDKPPPHYSNMLFSADNPGKQKSPPPGVLYPRLCPNQFDEQFRR